MVVHAWYVFFVQIPDPNRKSGILSCFKDKKRETAHCRLSSAACQHLPDNCTLIFSGEWWKPWAYYCERCCISMTNMLPIIDSAVLDSRIVNLTGSTDNFKNVPWILWLFCWLFLFIYVLKSNHLLYKIYSHVW